MGNREWWIHTFGEKNVLPQNRSHRVYDKEQMDYHSRYAEESRVEFYASHTHVIEHKAYVELKADLENKQEDFEALNEQNKLLFLEALKLAVALESIKRKVPELVSREEAADMAVEFKLVATDSLTNWQRYLEGKG